MQPDIASNPEVRELAEQTDQLLQIASSYRVTTAAEYTAAGEELKKVKAAAKRLDEIRLQRGHSD